MQTPMVDTIPVAIEISLLWNVAQSNSTEGSLFKRIYQFNRWSGSVADLAHWIPWWESWIAAALSWHSPMRRKPVSISPPGDFQSQPCGKIVIWSGDIWSENRLIIFNSTSRPTLVLRKSRICSGRLMKLPCFVRLLDPRVMSNDTLASTWSWCSFKWFDVSWPLNTLDDRSLDLPGWQKSSTGVVEQLFVNFVLSIDGNELTWSFFWMILMFFTFQLGVCNFYNQIL